METRVSINGHIYPKSVIIDAVNRYSQGIMPDVVIYYDKINPPLVSHLRKRDKILDLNLFKWEEE